MNEHKRAVRRLLLYDFAYTVQIFMSNFASGKIITGLDASSPKVPDQTGPGSTFP
jgi:hypothetical protein